MGLWTKEDYVNETKGYRFGDSGWQEAYTDNRGELFKACQREFGRCVSAMYVDQAGKPPLAIGWVFQKRMEYEDYRPGRGGDRYYVREVWVAVEEREEVTEEA